VPKRSRALNAADFMKNLRKHPGTQPEFADPATFFMMSSLFHHPPKKKPPLPKARTHSEGAALFDSAA
jgi:hypothetical protein